MHLLKHDLIWTSFTFFVMVVSSLQPFLLCPFLYVLLIKMLAFQVFHYGSLVCLVTPFLSPSKRYDFFVITFTVLLSTSLYVFHYAVSLCVDKASLNPHHRYFSTKCFTLVLKKRSHLGLVLPLLKRIASCFEKNNIHTSFLCISLFP